ncbi:MAG TPA: zinc ribbon domain-containing protein [Blastocatellia bacterium]|nr:zinc ribbon domain-containing protein [Blastocatellia bacterium]
MKLCPNCGAQAKDAARFCPNCAAILDKIESQPARMQSPVQSRSCPSCGSPVMGNAKYCNNCAAPIGGAGPIGYGRGGGSTSGNRNIIIIGAVTASMVLIGAIVLVVVLTTKGSSSSGEAAKNERANIAPNVAPLPRPDNKPDIKPDSTIGQADAKREADRIGEVIGRAYTALQEGDAETFYNLHARGVLTPDKARSVTQRLSQVYEGYGGIAGIDLIRADFSQDGRSATQQYQVNYGDGNRDVYTGRFVKEGGDWKIQSLE